MPLIAWPRWPFGNENNFVHFVQRPLGLRNSGLRIEFLNIAFSAHRLLRSHIKKWCDGLIYKASKLGIESLLVQSLEKLKKKNRKNFIVHFLITVLLCMAMQVKYLLEAWLNSVQNVYCSGDKVSGFEVLCLDYDVCWTVSILHQYINWRKAQKMENVLTFTGYSNV